MSAMLDGSASSLDGSGGRKRQGTELGSRSPAVCRVSVLFSKHTQF